MARFNVEREFQLSYRNVARLVDALTEEALDRLDPQRVVDREQARIRAEQAEREAADERTAALGRQLGQIGKSLRLFAEWVARGLREGDRG